MTLICSFSFKLQRGSQGNISKFWIVFLILCYVAVFVDWGIEVFSGPLRNSLDTLLMMGYAKAAITFVKYVPQVYLNWKRQSCEGWSFENVALDFTGGSLSFLQMALNSIALGEPLFEPGAFNVVKFILAITSIVFDSIFFFQFWLYKNNGKKGEQKELPDLSDYEGDGQGMLDNKTGTTNAYAVGKSQTVSNVSD